MAKIIITSEGKFVREVELVKERITIGRKPFNDITLDHRAVSSQHATLTLMQDEAVLEDLGSTNGTLMQGERVSRQKLTSGDKVTIAVFDLEFLATPPKGVPSGRIEVLNGVHTGKRIALSKALTTLGKPGTAVVAITFVGGAYLAVKIDGEIGPAINGTVLEAAARPLVHGDVLDLGGTRLAFLAK